MKRFIPALIAFVMLISCMQGIVFAEDFTYGLSQDAFVSWSQLKVNYGGDIQFWLNNKGENTSQDRFGLIKIDLSDWVGGEIDKVELGMYLYEGTDATTVVPGKVDFYKIEDNSWIESGASGVTYETRPAEQGTLVASTDVNTLNTWCTADLTDAVKNDADKILSFKVYSQPGVRLKFCSKESTTNKPYVKVTGVKASIPATGVTLSQNSLQLTTKSAPFTLTANVVPASASNKNINWSSSNTSVATVNNGVVTPVSEGQADITATSEDGGFTAVCNVTVQDIHVSGVTLDKDTLNLYQYGKSETLKATVNPVDATNSNVTWSSSNTNVATVNNGVVTPVAAGNAVITVITADGNYQDTCNVVVSASSDKQYTYQVSDDTYYAGDEAGPNGNSNYVYVRKSGASRTGYMKFEMPELDGFNIVSAKVYFQLNQAADDVPLYVKGFYDSNWTETTCSFKAQPNFTGLTSVLDTITVSKTGYWYSMDISNYTKTVKDGVLSLQFSSDSSSTSSNDKVYISSKESGVKPYVVVVTRPYEFNDNNTSNFTVKANKYNSGNEPYDGLLTACTFDKNGTLVNISADKQTINAGERKDFTVNFSNDYDPSNNYAKFFLIKSVTDPAPLTDDYKYIKGCSEYPQASDNVSGVIVDGNKITVKGKSTSKARVGLTVVKPNVDTGNIDYSNLIGSIKHIGTTSSDDNGNFSFAFSMDDSAPEGFYNAYVGFDNGDAATRISFLYAKNNNTIVDLISKAPSVYDLQCAIEPYAKYLNLNTSKIYTNHYLTLEDSKRKEIIGSILPRINTARSISDIMQITQEEISLYTVNFAPTYRVIQDYIVVSFDFLRIDNSYISKYNKLKDKTAVAKEIYGRKYTDISTLAADVKDAIDKAYNNEYPPNPSNSGSGGGGSSKGTTLQIGTIISTPTPTPTQTPNNFEFIDLNGFEWAIDSINNLARKNKISTDTNTFKPGDNVTREEFVKMLIGGLDLTDKTAQCSFNDVNKSEWYYEYIATAVKLGIVNGVSDDSFGIGQNITRQDMATMVYHAVKVKGISLTDNTNLNFTDSSEISDYAKLPIGTMQTAGIITGIEDGKFDPNGNANRAQAAVIISRLLDL